jgi:hypothetical protein
MSSKSIYPTDLIAELLGMSPQYNIDYSIPEDGENVPLTGEELFFGGFKGHTHSKEHKQKLSILMKEKRANNLSMGNHKPHTQETRNKVSEGLRGNTNKLGKTGAKLSDEFKENRRKIMTENNPMHNPESRAKSSKAALRKWPCKTCGKEMNKGNLSRHELKCK